MCGVVIVWVWCVGVVSVVSVSVGECVKCVGVVSV